MKIKFTVKGVIGMENFFSTNHAKLNETWQKFCRSLSDELRLTFYRPDFKICYDHRAKRSDNYLNCLGLYFLRIQAQVLDGERWVKDKKWKITSEMIPGIANICATVAKKYDFAFLGTTEDDDGETLFIIRYCDATVDPDLIKQYSH